MYSVTPRPVFDDVHPLVEQSKFIFHHYRNASIKSANINIIELNEDS
jgi:hypothetical protein